MQSQAVRELTETLALALLERDGIAVIWLLDLAAAKADGDGHARAAEALLQIADAAEGCLERAAALEPRSQGIWPN